MGIQKDSIKFERLVPEILTVSGNVGGFISGLNLTWMFLVHFFASNLIDAKTTMVFNKAVLGREDPCGDDHEKFLGLRFQMKLFIYKFIFCKKKKCSNLFSDREQFLKDVEHIEDNLQVINESLSLRATMKYNNVL